MKERKHSSSLETGSRRAVVQDWERLGIAPTRVTTWKGPDGQKIYTTEAAAAWVSEPLSGKWAGWRMASRIMADKRGQPVIAEIRVFPYEAGVHDNGVWSAEYLGDDARESVPTGGIPATLVRRGLPIAEHVAQARVVIGQLSALSDLGLLPAVASFSSRLQERGYDMEGLRASLTPRPAESNSTVPPRRGRPETRTVRDYARIALLYDDAVRANRSPISAIAEAEHVTSAIARNLVAKARGKTLGLLPQAVGRGRKLPLMPPPLREQVEQIARGETPVLDLTEQGQRITAKNTGRRRRAHDGKSTRTR